MKSKFVKRLNKNHLPVLVLLILILVFIAGTVTRYSHASQVEGQWAEFDSQNYIYGENNPDGFRLEYPQSWPLAAYEGGGPRNLKDARLGFDEPHFLFTPSTYLYVWWRRVDENWTLEDVRDWYIEELGFGINRPDLEQNRNAFQKVTVGVGDYPALSQIFGQGTRSVKQIVLFIVGDEAFILVFSTPGFDYYSDAFNRMLNSFEVYE